jgi:hypothetical protein
LIDVLSNDTDSDGTLRPNTLAIVTGPSNGSASINGRRINYTPNANYNGTDSFVYRICDDDGACDTATVTIRIRAINDSPVAVDDTANTSVGTPVTITVLSNDYDPEGDTISVTAVGSSAGGAVGLVGDTVVYTPTVNGTHTFTYTIEDTSGLTDNAVITVAVIAPPVAVDDPADTAEDIPVIIDVLDNDSDPDGDPLTVTFASTPLSGTTTVNVPGYTVTYIPDPDYNGTDTFTYTISDGIFTDTATVIITILAVNDLPVAVDDSYSTRITVPTLTIPAPGLLDNDIDVDGDSLTVDLSSVSTPTGGASVGVNPDGSFIFFNYSSTGDYTFTYQALDTSLGSSNVATVTVTVTP